MQDSFKVILNIQELDIKMIRLLKVKKERQVEMDKINATKADFLEKVSLKEQEIAEIKKNTRMGELQIKEIQEKITRLESQQNAVKKMEEFNALTHEMTNANKERTAIEQHLSDLLDQLTAEEELLISIRQGLTSTEENGIILEKEIKESIRQINEEGQELLKERNSLISKAQPDMFKVYERLLRNKRDRVVVPIENRTCSGCHIVLTAQHENQVRKGDRLIFCEHCSRILYWQESEAVEGTAAATKRRRRRTTAANV